MTTTINLPGNYEKNDAILGDTQWEKLHQSIKRQNENKNEILM